MLCVLYAASKGWKVIGRINIVLFICFICLALAFLLSIDKADFRNVLPIADFEGWTNPIYAILAAMSFFVGLEVLYTFYPSVKNKTRGRNYAVIGVLASGVGFAVINFACVIVFGEYMLSDIGYSSMLLLRSSTNGLFIRLFLTLLFFNLMLIKPLINCGFAAEQHNFGIGAVSEKKALDYPGGMGPCGSHYSLFTPSCGRIGNFISCAAGIRGAVWTDSPHYGAYKISFC